MKIVLAFFNASEFDEQIVDLLNKFNLPATFYLSGRDLLRPFVRLIYRGSFEIGCSGLFGGNFSELANKDFPHPLRHPNADKLSWLEVEAIWNGWMIQGIFGTAPGTMSLGNLEEASEISAIEKIFPLCRNRPENNEIFFTDANFEEFIEKFDEFEKNNTSVVFLFNVANLTKSEKYKSFIKLLENLQKQRIEGIANLLTYHDYLHANNNRETDKLSIQNIEEMTSDIENLENSQEHPNFNLNHNLHK